MLPRHTPHFEYHWHEQCTLPTHKETRTVFNGGCRCRRQHYPGVQGLKWQRSIASLQMSDTGKSPCISILIFPPNLHETWLLKPSYAICFTCTLQTVGLGAKIENCVKWGLVFVFMWPITKECHSLGVLFHKEWSTKTHMFWAGRKYSQEKKHTLILK